MFAGGHVTADGRERGFQDGVGDEPNRLRVLPPGYSPAEGVQLALDLARQLSGPTAHCRRPSPVDEVLPPVE